MLQIFFHDPVSSKPTLISKEEFFDILKFLGCENPEFLFFELETNNALLYRGTKFVCATRNWLERLATPSILEYTPETYDNLK